MTDLSGREVLATGARGGLGAAIARKLAVRNAHVAVSGRHEGDCAPVVMHGMGKLMSDLDAVSGSGRTVACCPRRGACQTGSFLGLHRETAGSGN